VNWGSGVTGWRSPSSSRSSPARSPCCRCSSPLAVIVQGASIPYVARRLRIPFRRIDYDLAEVLEFVVRDDAFASGKRLGELPLGERAWVGVLIRDGRPRTIGDDVVLQPGDHVHVYCQPEDAAALARIFAGDYSS
jgi:cell volume regulation protein A